MERNIQRNGLIDLLALLVVGVAGFVLARIGHSLAGTVAMLLVGIGFLVAVVSWFQMRLEERERLEKLEFDELMKSKGGSALFESREADVFPAQRSREQFERFLVPVFTLLLFVLEAGGALLLWRWLVHADTGATPGQTMTALVPFATGALVLFLLGKFSATIARLENQRLLRPGASYLLLNAYSFAAVAVGLALVYLGYQPKADLFIARVVGVVPALIAVETLINLVLELYRPRVKGRVGRPLYESRVVGLLGQPEDLVSSAAQALDYQFGFKVSETWAYQMVAEKLWLFLLGMAAAAFLSTCFVFLEPGQQALVECFGHSATASTVIGPGAHLKWPWPIDKVYRFDTGAVQSFNVGFIPDPAHSNDTTAVWTTPHYKEEYNVLVASRDQQVASVTNQAPGEQSAPVNLVVVGIPVQYRITNVLEWAYGQADEAGARALLQQAATREIVRYFAGVDLLASMSDQREAAAKELQVRIQTQATQLHLGAEILFVGLQDIHPPVKVAGAFEDVNGAEQEVLSKILKAEADTNKTILLAGAQARAKVRTAEGAAGNRVLSAQAEAARFLNEMVAYDAAPEVYRQRMLLETLASTYSGARKYIIGPTNYYDVFQYNFEDQVGPDILKRMSVTNR